LKRKLKEANEKLKTANRVIAKNKRTKRNLMQQIKKIKKYKKKIIKRNLLLKSWEILSNKSKDSFYTNQMIISNGQSKSQHISLKLTKEYISINKGKVT